jgi:hypothetical protein
MSDDHEHYIDALPQGEKVEDVRWVYHTGYYDGPLSGMVRLSDGREVWAEMIEECGEDQGHCSFFRRFQLWQLTDHQYDIEARRHADFQRYVGGHTDYDENGRRDLSLVRPQEQWAPFYENWGGPPNSDGLKPLRLTDAIPAGWFER